MTAFDPVRFKEQERAGFNLVAERYEAGMALMQPVTARIIALADLEAGARVLDVATGPGIIARQVAGWVGTNGEVVGIDIAEKALELARARTADLIQVSYEVMDAENMSFDDDYFDRVVCSFGLMHFPNPDKALAEMRRVLKPGGKLVATVWGEAQDAPFIQVALQVIARNFPPPKVERPSMFRFGEPAVLNQLLSIDGFNSVTTERVNAIAQVADSHDYWRKFLDVAGITAVAFAKQPPELLEKLEQDTVGDLAPYADGDGYTLVNSVMVATGLA